MTAPTSSIHLGERGIHKIDCLVTAMVGGTTTSLLVNTCAVWRHATPTAVHSIPTITPAFYTMTFNAPVASRTSWLARDVSASLIHRCTHIQQPADSHNNRAHTVPAIGQNIPQHRTFSSDFSL